MSWSQLIVIVWFLPLGAQLFASSVVMSQQWRNWQLVTLKIYSRHVVISSPYFHFNWQLNLSVQSHVSQDYFHNLVRKWFLTFSLCLQLGMHWLNFACILHHRWLFLIVLQKLSVSFFVVLMITFALSTTVGRHQVSCKSELVVPLQELQKTSLNRNPRMKNK